MRSRVDFRPCHHNLPLLSARPAQVSVSGGQRRPRADRSIASGRRRNAFVLLFAGSGVSGPRPCRSIECCTLH